MLSLLIVVLFAVRFAYVCWFLDEASGQAPPRSKSYVPAFTLVAWLLFLWAHVYWSICGHPSPTKDSWFLIAGESDVAVWFIVLVAVTILLSGMAIYRYGMWVQRTRE